MIRNQSTRPLVLTLEAPPPPIAPPTVGGICGTEPEPEPEPEPAPEPGGTAGIYEGVPPRSSLARRLSADAGRVVAGLSGWRPAAAAAVEGEPWVDVENSLRNRPS